MMMMLEVKCVFEQNKQKPNLTGLHKKRAIANVFKSLRNTTCDRQIIKTQNITKVFLKPKWTCQTNLFFIYQNGHVFLAYILMVNDLSNQSQLSIQQIPAMGLTIISDKVPHTLVPCALATQKATSFSQPSSGCYYMFLANTHIYGYNWCVGSTIKWTR